MRISSCDFVAATLALLSLRAFAGGPEPIFHESLDSARPEGSNVQLRFPSEIGEGKVGHAVLLESRTQNLVANATLDADKGSWILMKGSTIRDRQLSLTKGSLARQVVNALSADALYCFSIYAQSQDGKPGRISLEWEGAEGGNSKEVDVAAEPVRIWVSGRSQGGSATLTIRCLSGVVSVERPQFEKGGTVPTSFLATGQRGVSGLLWTPGEGEFNPTQGTVSFWVKPNWAGETMSSSKALFHSFREAADDWKQMSSVVMLNAWLLDPEKRDWHYGLILRLTDRNRKSELLMVPLHDLTKEWHHVAITWNLSDPENGRATIYLDGEVRANSDRIHSEGLEDAATVAFGQGLGGYLDGWLDDARIYKTDLSAEEIKTLSESGL